MTGKNRLSKFWHELKRRKVIHVIVVYASAALVIIELINNITEPLRLPEWTPTLVIVLLSIGFPLAIIFSWIFDISSKGISKTEPETEKLPTSLTEKPVPEKSIIVLPFENISSDPEQEYFSDGLTEEIITDLSYIKDLLVISRSSAMTFKGTKQTIKEIAGKVNVRYVLEGSVRKSNDKIRITAQLIDAQNDVHLWAKKYDGEVGDIFDIQEKVSGSIANELNLKLNTNQPNISNISDIRIFEVYYKAVNNVFHFEEEITIRNIEFLDNAMLQLGNHPLLLTIKAWAMWSLVTMGFKPLEYLSEVEKILQDSLKRDPDFSKTNSVLGWVNIHINYKKAIQYFKKSLQLDPNEQLALQGIVVMYSTIGKTDEAILYLNRLQQIDPLNYLTQWLRGGINFYNGNFKEAFYEWDNQYENHLKVASSSFFAALSLLYFESEEKVKEYIADKIDPTSQQSYDKLLRMLEQTLKNDTDSLTAELDQRFISLCKKDLSYAHHLATFYSLLNKKKDALRWMGIAIDEGFINYPMIAEKDTLLDNIRGEKKFSELVANAKYEWENFEV